MDLVDQKLMQKAKKGDHSAFAELVDKYRDKIYAYLYRMVGNREDALDLAQETFLRIYSNLRHFKLGRPFKPWLYRIATNLAIDFLRRRRPTVALDAPIADDESLRLELVEQGPGPAEQHERAELAAYLAQKVAELPPNYRSVILLRHGHDLSYQEIADILQVPVSTVKTRLFRAREALRLKLSEERSMWEAECQ
ncbi:MAG: sigma-70 family RNA polymerase sigma factor [Firmicutes bacterium]|nr:sigma-70 family RNA polymerase sigma factor [Bacillota bacterium]